MLSANEAIDRNKDFWYRHDLSAIPEDLLKKIGAFRDAYIIRNEPTDLSKVHNIFLDLLSKSNELKGISPIFHVDYINVIRKLIEEGTKVELVITRDVFDKVVDLVGLDNLINIVKRKNSLRLYLKDKLNLAMSVTDKFVSLGLFTLNGDYDYNMDLVSKDIEAIRWGYELFNHYIKDAKEFK